MSTSKYINSGTFIGHMSQRYIGSDGSIYAITSQTIQSNAFIKMPVIFYGSAQITKPEIGTLYAQTDVANPIPSAPSSLVAVDAGLGDAVNLSWVSSALYFNVYKKVGIVYTKLNPNVLTGGTSYLVGALTSGVPVNFVVRALNGLGQESPDSNVTSATPTLDENATRFTNPTYQIYIDGTLWPTAILSSVELGFGSDLSTATFTLPIDPRESAPALDLPVIVYINGRRLFKGFISIKNDSVDSSGLQIQYICHSNIIELTKYTMYSTDVRSTNTMFNVPDTTPENMAILRNAASVNDILSKLGVSGGPNEYPGYVDITDQTPLAAAELVVSRVGNYRLYHDMVADTTSVYQFGSYGTTIRNFQFAKNIVNYKIDESYVDVIKQVTVIGALTKVTQTISVSPIGYTDADGRMLMSFNVSGSNIRDIQVVGTQRAKPKVNYDEEIQVTLNDFVGVGTPSSEFQAAFEDTSFKWRSATGEVLNSTNSKTLFPVVTSYSTYSPTRTALGAKVMYSDSDSATIFLNEIPKMWYGVFKKGNVKRATVGGKSATFSSQDTYGNWSTQDVFGNGGTMEAEILLYYDFFTGTVEVQYTIDTPPPVVSEGSGEPSKSITDTQYEIINNATPLALSGWSNSKFGSTMYNGSSNADVYGRMRARALAELAKAQNPPISGSVTVVGDETIDLRSAIKVKGQNLEVSHVSHSFQNGYTTTVSLTNEPFVKNINFAPQFYGNPKTNEKSSKSIFWDVRTETYMKLKKELAGQKDTVDKNPSFSGKYAIYQD